MSTRRSPLAIFTGKEVLNKVSEYSEIYGEVLLGMHREFDRLRGTVENYRKELEAALKEIRQSIADVKEIHADIKGRARAVAEAVERVAGGLEAMRAIEGRLLSLTEQFRQHEEELKLIPVRTAVARRALGLSVLALVIAVGVVVWTLV